ncbi:similar to integral membrane protein [Plenodomus lingam JN3]|uniref:Similar to integral membrane protein n=1 Tax=Leptosphaeria maculans (strain JN3 / isolate v23.1.3 / race Av1-4-5-6-7-8) TaxID=985895 RepID=E4ZPF6_LEPMJ|nr:similar to integral membrane protein [Plenodomus lingam JN3]CBX93181.1 similar to integral membrane protein [Plenodomus lingam JN3]
MSMTTQTLQGAVLSITSNVLAQAISAYRSNSPFTLNFSQVYKFALFSVLSNPPNIIWQGFLEDQFPTNVRTPAQPSSAQKGKKPDANQTTLSKRNVLIKFLLDQTIGALVNTLMFIAYMSYINHSQTSAQGQLDMGGPWDAVKTDCGVKTWPMMKDGYKFWPLISLVSFLWVPVERRVVFGCSVGVIWGIYLSLAAA